MTEYIDIIELDDKEEETVIGKCEKHEIHEKGYLHRFVGIMIFNLKGELLLQQIKANKKRAAFQYGLSMAGHVSSGETYEEAVYRELKEELGIDLPKNELSFLFVIEEKGNDSYKENMIGKIYQLVYDGPFEKNNWQVEAENIKFFNLDMLKKEMEAENSQYTFTQGLKNTFYKYLKYNNTKTK